MDKILAALAVIVLLLVFTVYPQHKNCGLVLAAALGGAAFLLNRYESGKPITLKQFGLS